ncbi:DUF1990 family protein [Blastopirellula marina]|uniref:DUF1990 domain-containing protein n=1 Tax=Blastopirellula marina TaxID=124 RepID=A0A2S8GP62_9BACT|nr:DUF1990 domain-containing protein [Blastopirellula marina]PQO46236.1 DUF1990 domain-containing protein [Blastopirellula marina]
MIHLTLPAADTIEQFLYRQRGESFTYAQQGSTANTPPDGFQIDRTYAKIGHGIEAFRAAKQALETWQQFDLGWVVAQPNETEIRPGNSVCVIGRAAGMYWMNACRIIYVVDETTPNPRFGFAYGTLPAHMEAGEERFLVEMDDAGDVWYEIYAFSRPRRLITWLTYFYMRVLQKRFHRDSAARMKALACGDVSPADDQPVAQLSRL